MTDIVERLRDRNVPLNAAIINEAADEIERLRNVAQAARDAFIAGFEAFPGPRGSWDREKIKQDAELEWLKYSTALSSAQCGDVAE
jgi:hypothetical protein